MSTICSTSFEGIQLTTPRDDQVVQAFDLDDTLNLKPEAFDNAGLTKDEFFDLAQTFTTDEAVAYLARLLHSKGDAIAITTARPIERLQQTKTWLEEHDIPFDVIMHARASVPSCIAKQEMLQYLQLHYRMVGTLFDDSPYNCEGAHHQGVSTVHIPKNCQYWAANPEVVYCLS